MDIPPILERQTTHVQRAFWLLLDDIQRTHGIVTCDVPKLTKLLVSIDGYVPYDIYDTPEKLSGYIMRTEIRPWVHKCIKQFQGWAHEYLDMELRDLEAWHTIQACMNELHPGGLWLLDPPIIVARTTGGWLNR